MIGTGNLGVHLLPAWIPADGLRGGVAVVIDVLRATTVMVQAFAAGARGIRPCLEIEEARALASEFSDGPALLAGERRGLPVPGFDLGNSPDEFTAERCGGRTIVMTTTNGTRALLACRDAGAERILVGAFTNLSAVVAALAAETRSIHLVCAGTEGVPSLEDAYLAGAIADRLIRRGGRRPSDSALFAARAWSSDPADPGRLEQALGEGKGGRRVREIGRAVDIAAACRIDRHPAILPELRDGPIRLVLGP